MVSSPPRIKVVAPNRAVPRIFFATPQVEQRYATHRAKWHKCKDCQLHKFRSQVVLYRGHLPCDVLFVGFGPSSSDDVLGHPFLGEHGDLLNTMLEKVWDQFTHTHYTVTAGFTHIVSCQPVVQQELSSPIPRSPTRGEAELCSARLAELIEIAHPKLIVTLGADARRMLPYAMGKCDPKRFKEAPALYTELPHPFQILKKEQESAAQGALMMKRFVLDLTAIMGEHL